jgi:ABC-type nickel/cobalt efflux system permease component RcnA
VFGLDDSIAKLGGGGGLAMALVVAVLLGLRHATDPDHLTAVSTLIVSDERHGSRRASMLGLAWGLGHAITLFALGMPVVLFGSSLPEAVQRAAEAAIGIVIIALAMRLLVRWRRGYFHVHAHEHGSLRHAHPHVHEDAGDHRRSAQAPAAGHAAAHEHRHPPDTLGRSPRAALGIGMVHGVGGSAGVGILLVGAISQQVEAVVALLLFAGATAVSMALLSSAFGHALARGPVARQLRRAVPALGGLSLLFGAWYTLGALDVVPSVFG